MNRKAVVFLILSLLVTYNLYAQEPSPTPAPSKTPPDIETNAPEATALLQASTNKPLTQADLAVITANTQRPNGITWYDDKLYTICSGDSTIYEIDAATGDTIQYLFGVKNAHTLYAANTNNNLVLWIPDFESNTLLTVERGVAKNIATGLNGPWGITPLNEESFLVTNLRGNNAVRIGSNGEVQEIISNLRSPTGVTTNDEYIFIANTGSARRAIEWFPKEQVMNTEPDSPLAADTDGKPLVTGLQNVTGITLGSDGWLYFAYALGTRGVVGRVDPNACVDNGGCTNDQIEVVVFTELSVPLAGLTLSPDMKLYVHSMFSPDLYWVQLPTSQPQ